PLGGSPSSAFVQRVAGVPVADRRRLVADVVRTHVAAALGHASTGAVEPSRAFKELGFDSLTAVELRNRLRSATGQALPATLAFDYPSAERHAANVLAQVVGSAEAAAPTGAAVPVAVQDDPVVSVGMGLRVPGGVETPEA
ncbi:acyl carrier protein, partial [Streptomyces sp. BE303]|uniref:acyl carrier protein n=1 Tax=Streptomyces sp. BE303 TaxID=3002528 RepID=UPI002E76D912